ncbi:glycosyltransferase family 4 protein [Patescibacteria group bacterium]
MRKKSATDTIIGIDARAFSTSWTGIGRYLRNLTRELVVIDQPYKFVVFLPPQEMDSFDAPNDRVKKVSVDIPHYSWQEQIFFKRYIGREKIDLMHFPHFNIPLTYRKPFVATIHDLTLSFFPGQKMTGFVHRIGYQMAIRHAATHSSKVIAVSNNTKRDLEQLMDIDQSKVHVIYESVEFDKYHTNHDPEEIQRVTRSSGIRKPFLLYAGVWRSHKNILGMLEGFRKILDRGLDYQLVITGKPDPHYPEIQDKIERMNLGNNVVLPGFVSDSELPLLYAGAGLFLFPSFYEGFGLPPLEAMASGTPVVSSNTSAMPEVLNDAVEFFDPYDTEDMARSLEKVLRNQSYQEELRNKGLVHVKQFSWKKMADETLKVYKSVLK